MTYKEKIENLELISKRFDFNEDANKSLLQLITDIHNLHLAEIDVLQRAAVKKERQVEANNKFVKRSCYSE